MRRFSWRRGVGFVAAGVLVLLSAGLLRTGWPGCLVRFRTDSGGQNTTPSLEHQAPVSDGAPVMPDGVAGAHDEHAVSRSAEHVSEVCLELLRREKLHADLLLANGGLDALLTCPANRASVLPGVSRSDLTSAVRKLLGHESPPEIWAYATLVCSLRECLGPGESGWWPQFAGSLAAGLQASDDRVWRAAIVQILHDDEAVLARVLDSEPDHHVVANAIRFSTVELSDRLRAAMGRRVSFLLMSSSQYCRCIGAEAAKQSIAVPGVVDACLQALAREGDMDVAVSLIGALRKSESRAAQDELDRIALDPAQDDRLREATGRSIDYKR